MEKYIGTRIIRADYMNRADYNFMRGWTLPSDENGSDEGYVVIDDETEHTSWLPIAEFNNLYRKSGELTFGLAIELLKKGKRVCRVGWNGAGMFLRLIEQDHYELLDEKVPEFKRGREWNLLPFIMMKTAQNTLVPWLASQTDILSEDWMVLDD